jgi:modulator of FtsH protease
MKREVSSLGKWLFVGLMVMIVAGIANIWLQMPALYLAMSAMGVVIFSAFILYDLKQIIDGGETNYVTATLSVYLSVYNLFSSLLHLLTALGGED